MAQQVTLKAGGLFLSPDPLAEVPPGAMEDAKNVVIDRPGLVAPRERFGEVTQPASINGDESVYVVPWDGDRFTVSRDGSSTKLYNWTEDQEVTDEAAASLAFTVGEFDHFEAAGALFFTEGGGIRKLADSADTTAGLAGWSGAPALYAVPYGTASTHGTNPWLTQNDCVAYRATITRTDGARLIVSPPTGRAVARNYSTVTKSVFLRAALPSDAVAGDVVDFYRSGVVLSDIDGTPDDEMRLRHSITIEAADITAGYVQFIDEQAEGEWIPGTYLHTNETQQGALAAQFRPGAATCATWFNAMAFYGGHTSPHRMVLELLSLGNEATPTESLLVSTVTGDITSGSAVVTNVSLADVSKLVVGQVVYRDAYPANAFGTGEIRKIDSINDSSAPYSFTMDGIVSVTQAAETIFASDWIAVDGTEMYTTWRNDNTTTANKTGAPQQTWAYRKRAAVTTPADANDGGAPATLAYLGTALLDGFTVSAADDGISIFVTIERDTPTGAAFEVTGTKSEAWSEDVDITTAITSTQDGGSHRLAWSKTDQPEAVPITHFQDIGSEGKAILALARTRDSLFIFKEDGTWKLTGETPESLRIDEFDLNLRLVHPDAVCEFGGQVIAWTTRGVVAVSEGGVTELSAQLDQAHLEDRSNDVLSAANPRQTEFVFMFGDEQSKRLYMALANGGGSDDIVYVLSTRTGAWTRWDFHDSDGVHDGAFDETTGQALFGTDGGECLREEDLGGYGYDDALPFGAITITGDTVAILPGSGWTPEVGDIVVGAGWLARVTVVNTATNFDIEALSGTPATGTLTGYSCFDAVVKWAPQAAGAPAYSKHWRDLVMVYQECANHPPTKVEFDADGVDGSGSIEVGEYSNTSAPRYFRGSVSRNAARCTRLGVQATFHGFTQWLLSGISLTFEPESERL